MAYAGFDRADCPGLALMARLRAETNLVWCGYYLAAPSQPAPTWRGKRAALVAQGWGLAPIYVGQQVSGPGSHNVTSTQGFADGERAAETAASEGFPKGSWVYLDLENGPPLVAQQRAYVRAWASSLINGGYRPGIYCSFLFAGEIAALVPEARIWTFHVQTIARHAVEGACFGAADPCLSGYAKASVWQHDDSAVLSGFGDLLVDLDSAAMADPGAPDSA
jgi:hypothetical protein